MTTCIVLAAGRSTRMGHPKALTRIGGSTAVERIVAASRDAGVNDVIIVVPAGVELPPLGDARIVRNPDPDAGRTGSLQRGLRVTSARAVLVWPVDHPLASADSVRALLATSSTWAVPEHAGRGGHPIVLRGLALDAVLSAPPATPLRDIPGAVGIEVTRVSVQDAGVLANIDTPEDAARFA